MGYVARTGGDEAALLAAADMVVQRWAGVQLGREGAAARLRAEASIPQ